MPRTLRLVSAAAVALTAACRARTPAPPPPPPGFGVHVVSAANASANTRFSVTVKGGLQLSIRAPMFAMRPDSTLLLATPADLIVNKGTGSAIIVSADSNVALVATQLDTLAAPPGAVRGHVILLARPDTTRRVTITAGADSLAPKEKRP